MFLLRFSLIPLAILTVSLAEAAPIVWVSTSDSRLGRVDAATGATTFLPIVDSRNRRLVMNDIAFSPTRGLFGVTFEGSGNNLWKIDTRSGKSTFVRNLGRPPVTENLNALAFDSDGTLFAAGIDTTGTESLLYSIDLTGVVSTIGAIFSGNQRLVSSGDLEFAGGSLYLSVLGAQSDELFRFTNPENNGQGNVIGDIDFSRVHGLAFTNNSMHAFSTNQLFTINLRTGAGGGAKQINDRNAVITGATAVPEPSSMSLAIVALCNLLVVYCFCKIKRKRQCLQVCK